MSVDSIFELHFHCEVSGGFGGLVELDAVPLLMASAFAFVRVTGEAPFCLNRPRRAHGPRAFVAGHG